jgi:hypothetical protein
MLAVEALAVSGPQNILFPESPGQYVFYYNTSVKENKKKQELP